VTIGDSLDGKKMPVPYRAGSDLAYPFPANTGYTTYDNAIGILDKTKKSGFRRRPVGGEKIYGYDEVQYHKRPTAKDIKSVTFSKEPSTALKNKLGKQGITWSVVALPEDN